MTRREHFEFQRTKLIVEHVHQRIGMECRYLARDWIKDEQAMRESVRTKQALRERDAAPVANFESWQHGQPVLSPEAQS